MNTRWDMEIDILVVGAGGCGLAAALAANELGVEVGVVEKFEGFQGNATLSTGSVPGAGTRFQREAKIDDSPERFIQDLLRRSGPHEVEELTRFLAYESASLVEWLVDYAGSNLHIITDYLHVGHSVPRLHAPPPRKGKYLHDDLLRAVRARNIPIAAGSPVESLVTGDDGEVIGALVRGKRTGEQRIRAKKIILAACGFAANPEMVHQYCPEIAGAEYFGADGITGEAIVWGEKLGGQLANIRAYTGYAIASYPHGSFLSWTVIEKGGIVVDQKGRRFGDESVGYSGFTPEVLAHGTSGPAHPCLAYAIFDTHIRDYVASHELEFRELLELGGIKDRTSIPDLANTYGLDPRSLKETIEAYNAAARGETLDEFGRTDFGFSPLRSPYVICQVTPGLTATNGGLKVNNQAMVLRADNQVIKNLFAGGGVAAGLSGVRGSRGYMSGNGLLCALGLGRIAGEAAAKQVIEGV